MFNMFCFKTKKIKLYSNIKKAYESTLTRKQKEKFFEEKIQKIKNKKIINVIFYVSESAKWSAHSLFECLNNDKNFSVKFVIQRTDINEINFFRSFGVEVIPVYNDKGEEFDILTLSPDIVIYQQPWSICATNAIERIYKEALTAYVPYGYMSINSDGAHYFQPFHWHLWKYFCENNKQKQLFIKRNKILKNILYNSGYPKFDVYFDYKPKQSNTNKTIIWAPHWSIGEKTIGFGTFDKNHEFFYNLAKKNPHINWIYKPHPALKNRILQIELMTKDEYEAYLKKWAALPNTKIVTDGNYFDTFFESDVLITDSVSFLFEYLPTKKPIIHIDSQKSCGFNEITKPIVKSYYNVTTNEEIEKTIKTVVLDENDYKYKQRMKHLKNFMDNKTPAGENIVKYLKKELQIGESDD